MISDHFTYYACPYSQTVKYYMDWNIAEDAYVPT